MEGKATLMQIGGQLSICHPRIQGDGLRFFIQGELSAQMVNRKLVAVAVGDGIKGVTCSERSHVVQ